MSETDWRPWLPEAVAVLLVLAVGFVEAVVLYAMTDGRIDGFAQTLVVAFAVGTFRRAPGAGLALVWGLGLLHVRFGAPIMLVEFALTAVFFGSARWGRSAVVVMSALSVPLAVVVAFVLHQGRTIFLHLLVGGSRLDDVISQRPTVELALSLVAMLLVAAPWPAGLVMRSVDGARASRASMLAAEEAATLARRETDHIREIVELRDQQTRLARDVHDVVGHSLAVILAQAESGQYLADTERLKKTLQTIATSARSSLQDVREVLSSTQDPATVPGFDGLIAGVRGSGHEIVATEVGSPHQLSGETAAVAYRVFQEMLTNAIKHGRRDRPIVTERHWTTTPADALLIEVTNGTDGSSGDGRGGDGSAGLGRDGSAGHGRGLDGMRRRLDEIGGHLDVQAADTTFTVTAVVPVRDGAR